MAEQQAKGGLQLPQNVEFVFSKISQPGNLGFVARLLGNFGGQGLRFVNCCNHLDQEALRFATHSDVFLQNACTYFDLPSALSDCHFVVGTTARVRRNFSPLVPLTDIRPLISSLWQKNANLKVAFLFGNETSGLSNEELSLCQAFVTLPLAQKHCSLNVSHLAGILFYELSQGIAWRPAVLEDERPLYQTACRESVEGMKNHLIELLHEIHFIKPDKAASVNENVAVFLNKTEWTIKNVRIMRAMINKTLIALRRRKSKVC